MFGFFKGKPAALPSLVAPEVGASLRREKTFPGTPPQLAHAGYDHCTPLRAVGQPPQARFVGPDHDGPTVAAWRVAAHGGQPPLGIVNSSGETIRTAVWEITGDADKPAFVRQRSLSIDPAQASWGGFKTLDLACLPGDRLVFGLYYLGPNTRHQVTVYDVARNSFRKLGEAVRDNSGGAPGRLFETWPLAPDTALVLWHSGDLRVQAEVYVREYDHLTLFSPRHPDGLEVLKLGLDDGNVERWTMVGHVLWLETVDARDIRKPAAFVWSLDLSKLL